MQTHFLFNRSILQPQGMENLELKVCKATKDTASPFFTEGAFETPALPWEARYDNSYPNLIYDGEKYRCYYTVCTRDSDSEGVSRKERATRDYVPPAGRITSLCYAESKDGISWTKPALGLVDYKGSKANNIVFRYAHGTGVFFDKDETNPDKRYKLVTKVEYPSGSNFMAVNFSHDGIHWGDMIKWPKHNPAADSHNFVFKNQLDGKYKLITRIWKDGVRISAICESSDFINWTEAKEIARGRGFKTQVYSMPVFYYKGIYLGLASMFHEGDRADKDFDYVDCELKYSTKLEYFEDIVEDDYIIERGSGKYPDGEFDCGCIYAAIPTEIDDKICIYYMGGNGQHTNYRETSFGRAFLEKDKFAYYQPRNKNEYASIPTTNFNLYGNTLQILADIESNGSLEVAIKPSHNLSACEGFDFTDCKITKMSDGYYDISFGKELSDLNKNNHCIVMRFKNAKVYAIRGECANTSSRR